MFKHRLLIVMALFGFNSAQAGEVISDEVPLAPLVPLVPIKPKVEKKPAKTNPINPNDMLAPLTQEDPQPTYIDGRLWTEPAKVEAPKSPLPETKKEERVIVPIQALQTAPAKGQAIPRKKSVAVLEVRTVGTFDPKSVQGLTGFIVSETEKRGFKVVSGAEISAILGYEKQKSLLGCTDSNCLAQIGGSLGVDYLLDTEVSEVGGTWLIASTLISSARQQSIKRSHSRVDRLNVLIDSAQVTTTEVLSALPGLQPQSPTNPSPIRTMTTVGIVTACVGVAALGAGIYFGSEQNKMANSIKPSTMTYGQAVAAKDQANQNATAANSLFGVGGGLTILGTSLIIAGTW